MADMVDIVIQMLKLNGVKIPDEEEPINEVSYFVSDKFDEMMPDGKIASLFKRISMGYCNKNPEKVYIKLTEFANDVAAFNRKMIADIEAEENTCANCGEKIMPGEEWYTGHEEVDDPFCSEQCVDDYIMKCVDMVEGED